MHWFVSHYLYKIFNFTTKTSHFNIISVTHFLLYNFKSDFKLWVFFGCSMAFPSHDNSWIDQMKNFAIKIYATVYQSSASIEFRVYWDLFDMHPRFSSRVKVVKWAVTCIC